MRKIKSLFIPALIFSALIGLASFNSAVANSDEFDNALNQLRQARQAFKEERAQEQNERQEALTERNQQRHQELEQQRVATEAKREEQRKKVLLRLIDIQIKHLERTEERINRMPNIDESLKTQLTTEANNMIQKLNAEKVKVQSASTMEELKSLAKELKTLFKEKRELIKKIVDAIHASRLNTAVSKAENRLAGLRAKVTELKNAGKNVAELEAKLSEAEGKIDDAQTKITSGATKEALQDLKSAYQLFRDIANKIKELQ